MDILTLLPILAAVGVAAGFVDAIAGGGGLISVPALMWAGLPPVQALATNKLQASFGSFTATANYYRNGLVKFRELRIAVFFTFIGSAAGALLVQTLPTDFLEWLIPLLLIIFALYLLFSPKAGDKERHQRITPTFFGLLIGSSVGFYDGFFGPGTGSFFTFAFIALLGYTLPQATGGTKLLNFTSNFAALVVFILSGKVLWLIGLVMGCGQIFGAYLGSHVTIRHGSRIIRPVLVAVSITLAAKLLLQQL